MDGYYSKILGVQRVRRENVSGPFAVRDETARNRAYEGRAADQVSVSEVECGRAAQVRNPPRYVCSSNRNGESHACSNGLQVHRHAALLPSPIAESKQHRPSRAGSVCTTHPTVDHVVRPDHFSLLVDRTVSGAGKDPANSVPVRHHRLDHRHANAQSASPFGQLSPLARQSCLA